MVPTWRRWTGDSMDGSSTGTRRACHGSAGGCTGLRGPRGAERKQKGQGEKGGDRAEIGGEGGGGRGGKVRPADRGHPERVAELLGRHQHAGGRTGPAGVHAG